MCWTEHPMRRFARSRNTSNREFSQAAKASVIQAKVPRCFRLGSEEVKIKVRELH
jgi:hypothetical protein